jgi:uncharacterized protein
MSEQENVSFIQKMFEAFGRGDVETIVDGCAPDCEFYVPGPPVIPYSGRKKGQEAIRDYLKLVLEVQSVTELRIDQFVAQGDNVVAIGESCGIAKATGKPIESPVVFTFEIREGSIRRHMLIADTASVASSYTAAYAAAGS